LAVVAVLGGILSGLDSLLQGIFQGIGRNSDCREAWHRSEECVDAGVQTPIPYATEQGIKRMKQGIQVGYQATVLLRKPV